VPDPLTLTPTRERETEREETEGGRRREGGWGGALTGATPEHPSMSQETKRKPCTHRASARQRVSVVAVASNRVMSRELTDSILPFQWLCDPWERPCCLWPVSGARPTRVSHDLLQGGPTAGSENDRLVDGVHGGCANSSRYRGTSLIRNTHPPRITIGPLA